jgi:DNA-binding response OmpR family regulator
MKKIINVLVMEDNKYYNDLLSAALRQSIRKIQEKSDYKMVFHTFTDSQKFMKQIKSNDLLQNDTIAFVDYYLGDGINGSHIIKMLKEQSKEVLVILLSQSRSVGQKQNQIKYDYFVAKDSSALALCCLYLEQYADNKFM